MWNLPAKNWHSGENIQYLTSYCKVITNNSLCKYMQLKLVLTDLMVDAEWALRSKNHAMMNLKENSKNEFITRKPTLTNPHCCCWWWSMMMMILHGLCPKNEPTLASCIFVKHGLILIILAKQHQHTFEDYMHILLFAYLHFYLLYLLLNSCDGNDSTPATLSSASLTHCELAKHHKMSSTKLLVNIKIVKVKGHHFEHVLK